jgi:hypothetical protein
MYNIIYHIIQVTPLWYKDDPDIERAARPYDHKSLEFDPPEAFTNWGDGKAKILKSPIYGDLKLVKILGALTSQIVFSGRGGESHWRLMQ